jgi:hypothetical protein
MGIEWEEWNKEEICVPENYLEFIFSSMCDIEHFFFYVIRPFSSSGNFGNTLEGLEDILIMWVERE